LILSKGSFPELQLPVLQFKHCGAYLRGKAVPELAPAPVMAEKRKELTSQRHDAERQASDGSCAPGNRAGGFPVILGRSFHTGIGVH